MNAGDTTPEAVVFDLGKVLLDFDYGIATRKLAQHCGVSHEAVGGVIDQSPLLYAYETGHITCDDFYRQVCSRTGFRGDMGVFSASFSDIFTPIDEMIALHRRLRERAVPTYIFSNTNPIAIAHIRGQFPFFKDFDGYVLSYEHGTMKPEARIYEQVEKVTGKGRAEVLYIDDRPENIEAGRARGWQVIHHTEPKKTVTAVERLRLV